MNPNSIRGITVSARPGEFNINPFAGSLGRNNGSESSSIQEQTAVAGADPNRVVAWDNGIGYNFAGEPIARQTSTTQAPAGGGGGTARSALNQVAVDNTLGSIRALDEILGRQLSENQGQFDETQQRLAAQRAQQQGRFDEGIVTNNQNYGRNLMSSVSGGIRGLQGLMEVLGGAARGSMGDWARQAVSRQTASDIQMGADTQKENQGVLETTLNSNLDSIAERERENDLIRRNNEAAYRRERATQLQGLNQTLANLYGDAGRTAERDNYLRAAGALTPEIAQNSVAQRGTYSTEPSNIREAQIADFSAPTEQRMSATSNDGGDIGAGIFTIGNNRRKLSGQAV